MVKIIHVADDGTEKAAVELDDFTVEVIYSGIADMLRDAETAQAADVVPSLGPVPRGAAAPREGPDQDSRLSAPSPVPASRPGRSLHRRCAVGRIADAVCYVHPGVGPTWLGPATGAAELRRRWWVAEQCGDGGSVACWPRSCVAAGSCRRARHRLCSLRRHAGGSSTSAAGRPAPSPAPATGRAAWRHPTERGTGGPRRDRPPAQSFRGARTSERSPVPRREATASGCAAALDVPHAYAAPGFAFECPGNADGHQAMTVCISGTSPCSIDAHSSSSPTPARPPT